MCIANIIDNTNGKVILRVFIVQVIKDGLHHRRRELLGAQTVSTTDTNRIVMEMRRLLGHGFTNGRAYIQIQRLTDRARFFGAVQYGNLLRGG